MIATSPETIRAIKNIAWPMMPVLGVKFPIRVRILIRRPSQSVQTDLHIQGQLTCIPRNLNRLGQRACKNAGELYWLKGKSGWGWLDSSGSFAALRMTTGTDNDRSGQRRDAWVFPKRWEGLRNYLECSYGHQTRWFAALRQRSGRLVHWDCPN